MAETSVESYLRSRGNLKNDEDWITKRRVETVTTKNLEKKIKRQVVLEDGRVIVEDAPEVTVDTVEDRQSHEDEGEEDRSYALEGSWEPRVDHSDGTVLGEKFQRNTKTRDVKEHSLTTAAANNIGELSHTDVDKNALSIPPKVVGNDRSHRRTVDKEDVREVNRMHEGRVKTDRYVTRERIEDDIKDTPEEGSSTDSESRDGDAQAYKERKEERFIDYYRVPKGRPISEGKFIRRGIHLTKADKDDQYVPKPTVRTRSKALPYHSNNTDGDSSDYNVASSRTGARGKINMSERSYPPYQRHRGGGYGQHQRQDRFHTIERSQKVIADNSDRSYRSRSISRSSGHYNPRDYQHQQQRMLQYHPPSSTRSASLNRGARGESKSLLNSVKSLYATITRKKERAGRAKSHQSQGSVGSWFDGGSRSSRAPSAPPRKHRSSLYLNNGFEAGAADQGRPSSPRGWTSYTGEANAASPLPRMRMASVASSTSNRYARPTTTTTAASYRSNTNLTSQDQYDRLRRSKLERRKTISSYDDYMAGHRDPPRFEADGLAQHHHHHEVEQPQRASRPFVSGGRYFGDESSSRGASMERPPPDMRRLLLSNVNASRKKEGGGGSTGRPEIRAI